MTVTIQPWMIASAFLVLGLVGGVLISLCAGVWLAARGQARKSGGAT